MPLFNSNLIEFNLILFQTRCKPEEAVEMRNFLVCYLSSINGGRPSLMAGVTVKRVLNATNLLNGMFSVPVANHKTSGSLGPAFLQWSESVDFIVRTYIKCVR